MFLLLFAHDVCIDAFDADCAGEAGAAVCHACVCQNHFPASPEAEIKESCSRAERVVNSDSHFPIKIFSRSFFHPPKTLA